MDDDEAGSVRLRVTESFWRQLMMIVPACRHEAHHERVAIVGSMSDPSISLRGSCIKPTKCCSALDVTTKCRRSPRRGSNLRHWSARSCGDWCDY